MTATASKTKSADKPAVANASEKVTESILAIMQVFGIQSVECRKIKSADYERIIAVINPFSCAPDKVTESAAAVKDAIACILASVGVVKLEIVASDDDIRILGDSYKSLVEACGDNATDGSSKDEDKTGKAGSEECKRNDQQVS